ncbi:MAG: hypothetical protein BWK77_00920 [Verrucomicrobia bacterium A1]|nr:MAG: hypothetical protein BWK77_00920 [Verrucomicrobia bacterium A1]
MDVRKRVGDILNRVALRGDEFLIERKGKPLAVVLPVEKADAIRRAARLRLGEWRNSVAPCAIPACDGT